MSVLRANYVLQLPFLLPRYSYRLSTHNLHTSSPSSFPHDTIPTPTPNPPLDLDPALQTLLQDAELVPLRSNLRSRKQRKIRIASEATQSITRPPHRELEVLDATPDLQTTQEDTIFAEEEDLHNPFPLSERKSPAASFGSRGIGAVVLPFELQRSILRLISESDKPLIHADAERLFHDTPTPESEAEEAWSARYTPHSWSTRYTPPSYTEPRSTSKMSHIKARLNRHRDGIAFASVVMPAQYAVIRAVLEGVKTRLGDQWASGVDRIVEWGSGTGAGMWASSHTFRKPHSDVNPDQQIPYQTVEDAPDYMPDQQTASPSAADQDTNPTSDPEAIPDSSSTDTSPSPDTIPIPTPSSITRPPPPPSHSSDLFLTSTTITTYTGIEKRDGLTSIARRLLRDVPLRTSVSLQKTLHPSDRMPRASEEGLGSVALSAFMLSALGMPSLRREMVREMWDSGADVLVIIDDASADGFRHVADAREYLLKLGRREVDAVARDREEARAVSEQDSELNSEAEEDDGRGKRGSHVVAPCPHDQACPLAFHQNLTSSAKRASAVKSSVNSVRCTFAQRLQRPVFVRRTKHAGRGEEDVGYSYVVIRRGERERWGVGEDGEGVGRLGAVGRWAEEAAREKEERIEEERVMKERWAVEDGDGVEVKTVAEESVSVAEAVGVNEGDGEVVPVDGLQDEIDEDKGLTGEALVETLRNEAYGWPRINFPPLKRSGHVLIDACMPDGSIMRMTFPRSQGKQIFYDARKSSWGDLFPHAPKHRPVLRYTGSKTKSPPPKVEEQEVREDWSVGSDRKMMELDGDGERVKKTKKVKGVGRGRGGEGALQKAKRKAGLTSEGRAGWAGVMEELKEEDRKRRRERKRERGAKEVGDWV